MRVLLDEQVRGLTPGQDWETPYSAATSTTRLCWITTAVITSLDFDMAEASGPAPTPGSPQTSVQHVLRHLRESENFVIIWG